MSLSHSLLDNIHALEEGAKIISALTPHQYQAVMTPQFSASVGQHMRHILDHYDCFLQGIPTRHINYDQRARALHIETDKNSALQMLSRLAFQLKTITPSLTHADDQDHIQVSLRTSLSTETPVPVTSSLQRELIFLQSHTIHHYAIIASILKLLDVSVDNSFGVAASTLWHREQIQCAP